MINNAKHFWKNIISQRGSSLVEVIFTIALVLMITPFMYNQISDMNNSVKNIAIARRIINGEDNIVNYVRLNQASLETGSNVLSNDEIQDIAPLAHAGFVNKTVLNNLIITDIYLAFNLENNDYSVADIAKYIGTNAAVVHNDGKAYGPDWQVSIPADAGFNTGDLVLKITHDFGGDDKTKYLHRETIGGANLTSMERDLYMNNNDIVNVDTITGSGLAERNYGAIFTKLLSAKERLTANNVIFSKDATITGNVNVNLLIGQDASVFPKIYTYKLVGLEHPGTVALPYNTTVFENVMVGGSLKFADPSTESLGTVSGVTNIDVSGKLQSEYINANTLNFDTGTKLLVSNDFAKCNSNECATALKIGDTGWDFPSAMAPKFSHIMVSNVQAEDVLDITTVTDSDNFQNITKIGWWK